MYALFQNDGTSMGDFDEWDCIGTYEDKEQAQADLSDYWSNQPQLFTVMLYIPNWMISKKIIV